jgi:hypothetical protein
LSGQGPNPQTAIALKVLAAAIRKNSVIKSVDSVYVVAAFFDRWSWSRSMQSIATQNNIMMKKEMKPQV